MKNNYLPIDSRGNYYSKPSFWLKPKEYAKIRSEINQIYETQYKNKRIAAHTSFGIDGKAYVYWFENHGFDEYNIFYVVRDFH
jgi:hypothetical protein